MKTNFIIAEDVQEARDGKRMVQIKCKNCTDISIGNHLSIIIDHLNSSLALHSCSSCGAETKIHPDNMSKIKDILEIN